jgi:hypothetical protein
MLIGLKTYPRQSEQRDRPAIRHQAGRPQVSFDLDPQWHVRAVAVIASVEGDEAEAPQSEKPRGGGERLDLVEIEQEIEHVVGQPMPARPQTIVCDPPDIERRVHRLHQAASFVATGLPGR